MEIPVIGSQDLQTDSCLMTYREARRILEMQEPDYLHRVKEIKYVVIYHDKPGHFVSAEITKVWRGDIDSPPLLNLTLENGIEITSTPHRSVVPSATHGFWSVYQPNQVTNPFS